METSNLRLKVIPSIHNQQVTLLKQKPKDYKQKREKWLGIKRRHINFLAMIEIKK